MVVYYKTVRCPPTYLPCPYSWLKCDRSIFGGHSVLVLFYNGSEATWRSLQTVHSSKGLPIRLVYILSGVYFERERDETEREREGESILAI